MLLPNVDSDLIAVAKENAENAPGLGDVIDPITGYVVDSMNVKPEWISPWMRYVPVGELTEMTRVTFNKSALQDTREKIKGEHTISDSSSEYRKTVEKFSEILCKSFDIRAVVNQFENNHVLNIDRHVVVAIYGVRRINGGIRIIGYLPALFCFRSRNIPQAHQSHPRQNLDMVVQTNMRWMQSEVMSHNDSVRQAVTKSRSCNLYVYGLPRFNLDQLQRRAGCMLEILPWLR